jgi:hypothetical protein
MVGGSIIGVHHNTDIFAAEAKVIYGSFVRWRSYHICNNEPINKLLIVLTS